MHLALRHWSKRGCAALLVVAAFGATPSAQAREDANRGARVTAENAKLAPFRAQLLDHFDAAYQRYPAVPRGVLEAVAFVQSRWTPLAADSTKLSHQYRPQAWGVMGLTDGAGGFVDLIGAAAALLKVEREAVRRDAALNVMGAAALLDGAMRDAGLLRPTLEDLPAVLARVSGIAMEKQSAVQDFARLSFAYDVLLTLDRGMTITASLSRNVPSCGSAPLPRPGW